MTANEIRQQFLDFFEGKQHKIVPSAPMVNKDDPTLMFINAGMNQFKDYFLGHQSPGHPRIADTQKCLRVSGKHNDLEEVGIDSYHHTMFEMLGNWSIGDYFKKEAIAWAWELLTDVYQLPKDRLYVSVFEGDRIDDLEADEEAAEIWKNHIDEDRILYFDRKDNFWEMGDTGPCGPCSEIHIDLRPQKEIDQVPGQSLVNADHPQVIEIWNLVFIQFNRKADGSLDELPAKHIDTGMGFERLCMAIQGKFSNYDTDLFMPFIRFLESETGLTYGGGYKETDKADIAFRVLVDHIRAVSFAIGDGQLPSNTGAGYVIRRILRRAVRYYFSFLSRRKPLIHMMVPLLVDQFGHIFPEVSEQGAFIEKIILEEEKSFLRTLEAGLKKLQQLDLKVGDLLDGQTAFEMYDTFGFPIDLTRLIGAEEGWRVDESGFENALQVQKERSRADAKKEAGDWQELSSIDGVTFLGYDQLSATEVRIAKYRTVLSKEREVFQVVLDRTPFYAESGGQVGDRGILRVGDQVIQVLDTQKENDLIVHIVDQLPADLTGAILAQVDEDKRKPTEKNHTATHLVHAALREVLGDHVQQRGSLVNEKQLRFDFSHFEKMSDEQIGKVESIVNEKIRQNVVRLEQRDMPIAQAKESGAMMLFGEKYGDHVRMITFDPAFSVELCGGCHVPSTGYLGYFKIKSESAIAAGVRRIEALTGAVATSYVDTQLAELYEIKSLFKNSKNVTKQIRDLQNQHKLLEKEISAYKADQASALKDVIVGKVKEIGDINVITYQVEDVDMNSLKSLAFQIEQTLPRLGLCLGSTLDGKANLLVLISKDIVTDRLHAGQIIRHLAKHIRGGGGGQPFFATAGGKHPGGIAAALAEFEQMLML